jgi:hypothetical protein
MMEIEELSPRQCTINIGWVVGFLNWVAES